MQLRRCIEQGFQWKAKLKLTADIVHLQHDETKYQDQTHWHQGAMRVSKFGQLTVELRRDPLKFLLFVDNFTLNPFYPMPKFQVVFEESMVIQLPYWYLYLPRFLYRRLFRIFSKIWIFILQPFFSIWPFLTITKVLKILFATTPIFWTTFRFFLGDKILKCT